MMRPWAAARPLAVRAASCARRVVSKPGQALPPPTGTAAGPSGALHTSGAWCARGRRPAREIATRELRSEWSISRPALALPPPTGTAAKPLCRPAISHVIPQQLVQILNLHRWNCNVSGRSRKVTVGNYVRNLSGRGPANPCWPYQPAEARTAAGSRYPRAPRPGPARKVISHAIPLSVFQVLKSDR